MAVPLHRGRPRLPDHACYIRVQSSVYELWRERNTLDFAEVTNSVFAEY